MGQLTRGFESLFLRQTLRRASGSRVDAAEAHYGLGSAFSMQGKREDAVAEPREALRLRPNYPEAQQLLQRLAH